MHDWAGGPCVNFVDLDSEHLVSFKHGRCFQFQAVMRTFHNNLFQHQNLLSHIPGLISSHSQYQQIMFLICLITKTKRWGHYLKKAAMHVNYEANCDNQTGYNETQLNPGLQIKSSEPNRCVIFNSLKLIKPKKNSSLPRCLQPHVITNKFFTHLGKPRVNNR